MSYDATPTIELAAAFTPGPFNGPMISRYVITAPAATTPTEIARTGIVPEGARLTEYDNGVYFYDQRFTRLRTAA